MAEEKGAFLSLPVKAKERRTVVLAPYLADTNATGTTFISRLGRYLLYDLSARVLPHLIRRLLRHSQKSAILANDQAAKVLVAEFGDEVFPYDGPLVEEVERYDYSRFHDYVDGLERMSNALGKTGRGFSYKGISLIKVQEIRWIWPSTYAIAFARLTRRAIRNIEATKFKAAGINSYLPSAILAAEASGLSTGFGTRLTGWISSRIEAFTLRRFLRSIWVEFRGEARHRLPRVKVKLDKRKRLLVIGNFDRTIERLEKLLPRLAEAGYSVHAICLPRIKRVPELQAAGVSCSYVSQWISDAESAALFKRSKKLGRDWWQVAKDQLQDCGEEGIGFGKTVGLILKTHFTAGAPAAMYAAEVATIVLDEIRPDVVLNFEDWEFNRSISLLAESRGVPTLAYYCLSATGHAKMVRRTQSWMAVAGENLRASFAHQYADDHIRIVGDPLALGGLRKSTASDRRRVRESHGIEPDSPLILLLSTYPTFGLGLEDIEIYFKRTFAAAREITGARVIVKAHPAQPVHEVEGWLKSWEVDGVTVVRDDVLSDLCEAADLISVPISSAVHQAMMSSSPVVCLMHEQTISTFDSMGYDYLSGKGVRFISPDESATTVFRSLLFDPAAREEQLERAKLHVVEHVGPLDGEAPDRFVKFLDDILSSPKGMAA
jgi:hypothetical protein